MRVYLAGKISGAAGWRDAFVPGWSELLVRVTSFCLDEPAYWEVGGKVKQGPEWPVLPNGFLGIADYVGPFAVAWRDEDLFKPHNTDRVLPRGLAHGMTKTGPKVGAETRTEAESRRLVVDLCFQAIDCADVVVAVATDHSPGLLCEIGYARAKSRPVVAVARGDKALDWFPATACTAVREIPDDPDFWINAANYLRGGEYEPEPDEDPFYCGYGLFQILAQAFDAPGYYRSPWWQSRRQAALDRAGNKCQFCATTAGLSVHHNTYANVYREPDADLVVLCDPCHRAADAKRRVREKETTAGAR